MQMTGIRSVKCRFSENWVVMVHSKPDFSINHHSLNHKDRPIRPEHSPLFQLPGQTHPPWGKLVLQIGDTGIFEGEKYSSFSSFTPENELDFFSGVYQKICQLQQKCLITHTGTQHTLKRCDFHRFSGYFLYYSLAHYPGADAACVSMTLTSFQAPLRRNKWDGDG